MNEAWNIVLHVIPVLIGVLLATIKLGSVIKDAISEEVTPINNRLDRIEKRFMDATRDLWEHNASQDIKIDGVMVSHYRLQGAHEAFSKMREHHP